MLSFRTELFRILETVNETYPGEMSDADQHLAHFLVLLAAISGATDLEIAECVPEEGGRKYRGIFLGLDVIPPDFGNYPIALARLASVFAADTIDLGEIALFVRGKLRRRVVGDVGETDGAREMRSPDHK
jgi:hypothetical protein